ncbi:MAG: 3'-5' exonuclease domain-containing protein 2 [Bacteroidales bacterium]|nr:3'-5' exonuclease domain-containing protein 2 [Bacteroidales bacterium]
MESRRFLPEISKEDLGNYRVEAFDGKIYVIDSLKNLDHAMDLISNRRLLGFDTETKPSFRKGKRNKVALLQVAFDNTALLFRINRIGLPDPLISVLSNPEIIKVGVAVHDDIRILQNIKNFNPAGFVDLQKMAKEYGIESMSLKKLSAIVLGFRISKSQQVTDWNADVLSEAQMKYASTDAWVSYEIYRKLISGQQKSF